MGGKWMLNVIIAPNRTILWIFTLKTVKNNWVKPPAFSLITVLLFNHLEDVYVLWKGMIWSQWS